jgi:hypothetical protein
MTFGTLFLLWGLMTQAPPALVPQAPAQQDNVRVYVGTRYARSNNSVGAEALRRILHTRFVVTNDPEAADVTVHVSLFRAPHANWSAHPYWPEPYEIGATISGSGFVTILKVGGRSWESCAQELADRIKQLLPTPRRPARSLAT